MNNESPETDLHAPPVARPVIDYVATPSDAHIAPKIAPLVWCTLPAILGAGLLYETIRRIQADPSDIMAGAGTFALLVPVLLVSILTSGAVILAVLDSRKTVANVTLMTLNLIWFVAAIGYFFLRKTP